MHRTKSQRFLMILLCCFCTNVLATDIGIDNLKIYKIRAVGDYSGNTFDNTIEIWFTTPLTFPAQSLCTVTGRVYVDKNHDHIISAAYMAFAAGKTVNINVDTNLTIRNGSCEISFLDVVN